MPISQKWDSLGLVGSIPPEDPLDDDGTFPVFPDTDPVPEEEENDGAA